MAMLDIIDAMIRGGSISLFLLWIALLWRDHRAVAAGRVAIAMNVTIIAYLLSGLFKPHGTGQYPYIVFDMLSVMVPALFWLFARLWFDDRAHIGWRSWCPVLAFAALPLAQAALIAATGRYSWEIWASCASACSASRSRVCGSPGADARPIWSKRGAAFVSA